MVFFIISELEDVLKSGHYESSLGCENFDCFVDEVLKLEKKMNFFLKNAEKDIIMTEKMKMSNFILFVFHNFSKYIRHFFMKG